MAPVALSGVCVTITQGDLDPTLEGRALPDALEAAIAARPGTCPWDIDHAGWLVFLHHADVEKLHRRTLDEALAWCLVWLMTPEIGIGQFLV